MKVAVFGSGAGALSVAADLSLYGREVLMADLPEFAANLVPVRAQGGVRVVTGGRAIDPVSVLDDPAAAVAAAEMLIVVVPQFGHEPWLKTLLPHLRANQCLLFMGEGGGALFAAPDPRRERQGGRGPRRDEHAAVRGARRWTGSGLGRPQVGRHLPGRPARCRSRGVHVTARRRLAVHVSGRERL